MRSNAAKAMPAVDLNSCKRIDWYRGPVETIPAKVVEKTELANDGSAHKVKVTSTERISCLTIREGDPSFRPILEFLRHYFGPQLQPQGLLAKDKVTTPAGGLFLFTSKDIDNANWINLPEVPEQLFGLNRQIYCRELLAAIPLNRKVFDNNSEEQKFRISQLDAFFLHKPLPDWKSDPMYKMLFSWLREANESYGFIDESGKTIFTAGDCVSLDDRFSDGLLKVDTLDGIQFWTKSGKAAFPETFADTKIFHDQLCAVKRGGKWGYIDKSGKIVIKPTFDEAKDFAEDLAAVKVGENWGYINKSGSFAVQPQFQLAADFSESLAAVCKDHQIGFVDNKGNFVIKPQYQFAGPFIQNIATVATLEGPDKIHNVRYIDSTGKVLIDRTELLQKVSKEYQPDGGWSFSVGKNQIAVTDLLREQQAKLWRTAHTRDTQVKLLEAIYPANDVTHMSELCKDAEVTYSRTHHLNLLGEGYDDQAGSIDFSDGLLVARTANDKFAAFNPDGSTAFSIDAIDVNPFHDERARVVVRDKDDQIKYGYIGSDGKFVVAPNLFVAEDFSDGVAIIRRRHDTHLEIIDTTGKSLGATDLYSPAPFKEGLSRAGLGVSDTLVSDIRRFGPPEPPTPLPAEQLPTSDE
ncbi:MAG TPA: WG repeat-containing protein [Planktothrix sp.]